MTDADAPRSPFAGMADLSARRPVRVLPTDEIELMLASHQLYLKQNITKATARIFRRSLIGRSFRRTQSAGIKIDRALV